MHTFQPCDKEVSVTTSSFKAGSFLGTIPRNASCFIETARLRMQPIVRFQELPHLKLREKESTPAIVEDEFRPDSSGMR